MDILESMHIEPPAVPLAEVYAGPLRYKGFFEHPGLCHLRLFEGPTLRVAIVTEIKGNPGASITNAIEHVAEAIEETFDLPHVFAGNVWDKASILIEHWDKDSDVAAKNLDEYDVVKLGVATPSIPHFYAHPHWEYIKKEEVERLVGRAL